MRRRGYGPPAQEMSGWKTLVNDKSEKGLPTDIDREPDSVLPPGSATPNSPNPGSSSKGRGEGSRDLPEPYYNTNDGTPETLKERGRSQTEEGEEYGNPTKYDYGMPKRRNIPAGLEDPFPKERQHVQRGQEKIDDHRWYMENRAEVSREALRRYHKLKERAEFKRDRALRVKYPKRFERRHADEWDEWEAVMDEEVEGTAEDAEGMEKTALGAYHQTTKRRKKWRGIQRTKGRAYERKRKRNPRRKQQQRRWRKTRSRQGQYRTTQKRRRSNPARWRKRGEVLTAPEVQFAYGPGEDDIGILHSVSPMTGMVTFVTTKKDADPLMSVPVTVFLEAVLPLTEEDSDALFDILEAELGPDFYDDLEFTVDDLQECAKLYGANPDSSHFKSKCKELMGTHKLDEMDADQLAVVNAVLITRMEGPGFTRGTGAEEFEDEGDKYEIDPSDDSYYYGEVDLPPEARKAALRDLDRAWLRLASEVTRYMK